MIKKIILITAIVSMVFTLPLLSKTASAWDESSRLVMDFGTSHKLAVFNQILNPEAEKNLDPVTGLDGKTSTATVEKYYEDFTKPAAAPAMSVSIISGITK